MIGDVEKTGGLRYDKFARRKFKLGLTGKQITNRIIVKEKVESWGERSKVKIKKSLCPHYPTLI